jgi:hypothetical protein
MPYFQQCLTTLERQDQEKLEWGILLWLRKNKFQIKTFAVKIIFILRIISKRIKRMKNGPISTNFERKKL